MAIAYYREYRGVDNRLLSKMLGLMWNQLSSDEKSPYVYGPFHIQMVYLLTIGYLSSEQKQQKSGLR